MDYFSTRDSEHKVSAARAIASGLAPDGGLYVPSEYPHFTLEDIREMCSVGYGARAARVIAPYLPEFTSDEIDALVSAAYGGNFDVPEIAPTRFINENTGFLELWHGPTCAFKDMALQMLPHLLTASLKKLGEERQVCILVATSGDTGKAALEGFADVPGTRIIVFYPDGGVSDVQRLQMVTQSGDNVRVCAVKGNFDDAQAGVKAIFSDKELAERLNAKGWFLSSANSINWGRLLPQIAYYFSAYCDAVNAGVIRLGAPINFCVPTGNFGDILAGWYAKRMGLRVGKLICASNSNNVLTDFINTGCYDKNRSFHTTISPSMDILVSSNLERLLFGVTRRDAETAKYMRRLAESGKYNVDPRLAGSVAEGFFAQFCSDSDTLAEIRRSWDGDRYLIDTHTAVASRVLAEYRERTEDLTASVIVSTASPYKFCDSVLRALGGDAGRPGTQLIGELESLTGAKAPAPLKGLDKRVVRFEGSVERSAMTAEVEGFLNM